MPYTATNFADDTHVSRETLMDLQAWGKLLARWNAKINLVAPGTLPEFWHRHALDSWQITDFVPEKAKTCLDFGSGAGFPGIALAIHAKQFEGRKIEMVESAGKKANFLKTSIRELNLPATVSALRIESLEAKPADIITARAFAPLPKLLNYAAPFWKPDTVGIFHKGRTAKEELLQAKKTWNFDVESHMSVTDPDATILVITNLQSAG